MRSLALGKLLAHRSRLLLPDLEGLLRRGGAFRSGMISLPVGFAPGPAVSRVPDKRELPGLSAAAEAGTTAAPRGTTAEEAVTRISTFKRKKIKVRKDRARTVRRKIRRKSHKKRAKFKL